MILCNSLYVLPRHVNKVGIVVYDNLQNQEIFRLSGKKYNTIYNIKDIIRAEGFSFEPGRFGDVSRWYLKTSNNTYNIVLGYSHMFSTTYRVEELEHYWLCRSCMSAVPDTWTKCTVCK